MSRVGLTLLCSIALLTPIAVGCGGNDGSTEATTTVRSERTWVDSTRPAGSQPERALRVILWCPVLPSARPLLLMAHGFGGVPEDFEGYAQTLARAGYFVAALAFPLTNGDVPNYGGNLSDFVNQAGDISFVLSQLLAANADDSDALFGTIDANRVAALGHSLGGLAVIALTRKGCCRDSRVVATILVAALADLSSAFGADPITSGPPTLVIHGTADATINYSSSVDLYQTIDPPRLFVGITGAGHSDLIESPDDPPNSARSATQRASIAFLNWRFAGDLTFLNQTLSALEAEGDEVEYQLDSVGGSSTHAETE